MTIGSLDPSAENPTPIRVVVANLPAVIQELVTVSIQQQADMTLVGQLGDESELLSGQGLEADVLITSSSEVYPPGAALRQLLRTFPNLRVLMLTRSGDRAVAYWMGICHRLVENLTEETLLSDLRGLVRLRRLG